MNTDPFDAEDPVLGMVHLPPLPGAPRFDGDRAAVRERALEDAAALVAGGADGVVVENFGDAPFYPEDVPEHVVASMTRIAGDVADAVDAPVGVNVLRNDAAAAVSVAAAADAAFVRVNVHTGARVTDQGVVEGRAHETLRLRDRLGADVRILADVRVKHSAPLAGGRGGADDTDAAAAAAETVERGLADGLIVSGGGTGEGVDRDRLQAVAERASELDRSAPIFVGSGVTAETAGELLSVADGLIVGTALKEGGETTAPVDPDRVRAVVEAAER